MPNATNRLFSQPEQIQKSFKVSHPEAVELMKLQTMGVDYGERGVALDSEEFDDDAAFDIEELESALALQVRDGAVRRLFDRAYRAGVASARRKASLLGLSAKKKRLEEQCDAIGTNAVRVNPD